MKTKQILLLFFSTILLLMSCGQKEKHQKAVLYFKTINSEMDSTTSTVNTFWNQLSLATENTQQSPDKRFDSLKLDTLNQAFLASTSALETSIAKLTALEEFDAELALKDKALSNLTQTNILNKTAIVEVLKALKTGLGQLTDSQRDAFKQFSETAAQLQTSQDDLQKRYDEFQSKYKITTEDYGK